MTPPVTAPQQCEVRVTHSGLCHGLVMWWELSLCPNVSLSISPWKRTQVSQQQLIRFLQTTLYVLLECFVNNLYSYSGGTIGYKVYNCYLVLFTFRKVRMLRMYLIIFVT